jgi:hypothetical protein
MYIDLQELNSPINKDQQNTIDKLYKDIDWMWNLKSLNFNSKDQQIFSGLWYWIVTINCTLYIKLFKSKYSNSFKIHESIGDNIYLYIEETIEFYNWLLLNAETIASIYDIKTWYTKCIDSLNKILVLVWFLFLWLNKKQWFDISFSKRNELEEKVLEITKVYPKSQSLKWLYNTLYNIPRDREIKKRNNSSHRFFCPIGSQEKMEILNIYKITLCVYQLLLIWICEIWDYNPQFDL